MSRIKFPQEILYTMHATLKSFDPTEIKTVHHAADMAEELVSNHYKLSASQWLRRQYEIKTLEDLVDGEIVQGPFAQIIRYEGHKKDSALMSEAVDLYRICLQDHAILAALQAKPQLQLMPFALYIVCHELIHIVRFTKFLQHFNANEAERFEEEQRVHKQTWVILKEVPVEGMEIALDYYRHWHTPLERLQAQESNSHIFPQRGA